MKLIFVIESTCAANYLWISCPPNQKHDTCVVREKSGSVERVSESVANTVKVAAGIKLGSGSMFGKEVWKKGENYYKEITVKREKYILVKDETVFCKFQIAQRGKNKDFCRPTSYKTFSYYNYKRCTNLPICSDDQARPCTHPNEDRETSCKGATHSLSLLLPSLMGLVSLLQLL